jgi:hypothetical protein
MQENDGALDKNSVICDKKSLFQTRTIGKLPLYVKQNLPHDVVGLIDRAN